MSTKMPATLRLRYEAITPDVIAKYFSAKGIRPKCYQCGETKYAATTYSPEEGSSGTNDGRKILEVFEMSGVNTDFPTKLRIYPLICQQCGSIWNIDAGRLLRWKESNDGAGSSLIVDAEGSEEGQDDE